MDTPQEINDAPNATPEEILLRVDTDSKIRQSLNNKRELHSTLIVTFGESNSGKSTTFKKLIERPFNASTPSALDNKDATQIHQLEEVSSTTFPAMKTHHCFIDIPINSPENGGDIETLCKSLERKFAEDQSTLRNLPVSNESSSANLPIVLFFLSADTKLKGTNTSMMRSLKLLKESKLIQPNGQNLILVVTRALQLMPQIDDEDEDDQIANEAFIQNYNEVKIAVLEAIKTVLSISQEVLISLVENKGIKVLKKCPDSDFYELPNGEVSHYNVLKAIIDYCITSKSHNETISPEQTPSEPLTATQEKDDDDSFVIIEVEPKVDEKNDSSIQGLFKFPIIFLGHGICQNCGTIKEARLLTDNSCETPISSEKILVPQGVQVIHQDRHKSTINSFVFNEPTEFNSKLIKLGQNLSTLDIIRALGKTLPLEDLARHEQELEEITNNSNTYFFYQQERCTAVCEIENGGASAYLNCPKFGEDFQGLMNSFDIDDIGASNVFFDKWGTHFVTQQGVGGTIYVVCSLQQKVSDEKQEELKAIIDKFFVAIMNSSPAENVAGIINDIRKSGMNDEKILILRCAAEGKLHKFEEITSDILQNWDKTVIDDPINLTTYTRICPYYDLVRNDENKKNRLKNATTDYIENRCRKTHFGLAPVDHQTITVEPTTTNYAGQGKRRGLKDLFYCNVL
ncbi:unnamed protein product [Orchesella dallaii]|uniref:MACPF domain-containing protein n=1 Tax=Orchesella dallaii TaxID=48710 RepID=A0ABP1RJA9_9HEXA